MTPCAPLPPGGFALVAHPHTGQACASPAMRATNPPAYDICPES